MPSTLDAKKITSSEIHTHKAGAKEEEKVFKMEMEGARKMFFLGQWV